jgi:hypothetical protein
MSVTESVAFYRDMYEAGGGKVDLRTFLKVRPTPHRSHDI